MLFEQKIELVLAVRVLHQQVSTFLKSDETAGKWLEKRKSFHIRKFSGFESKSNQIKVAGSCDEIQHCQRVHPAHSKVDGRRTPQITFFFQTKEMVGNKLRSRELNCLILFPRYAWWCQNWTKNHSEEVGKEFGSICEEFTKQNIQNIQALTGWARRCLSWVTLFLVRAKSKGTRKFSNST